MFLLLGEAGPCHSPSYGLVAGLTPKPAFILLALSKMPDKMKRIS